MRPLLQDIKTSSAAARSLGLGALLSLGVGAILYVTTARTIESDAEARFGNMTRSVQYTISARIKSYTDLLRGTAGLFQTDRDVTREEFHRYVQALSLEENFPGIAVINYGKYVTDEQRPVFEQRMREEVARSAPAEMPFSIKPPGRRKSYTVLIYIEPEPIGHGKIGMDLEINPYPAKVLADTRDTGLLAASGTRVNILSGPHQYGLAMRLPIYRSNMPLRTVQERRAAYFGTVGIGFGVNKLLHGILDEMPIKGTRLIVNDLSPKPADSKDGGKDLVLFDSSATDTNPMPRIGKADGTTFNISLPINFNRRLWQADFSIPKSALYTRFDAYYPWWAMLAGCITTALLYALFNTLASSRRRAMKMAEEMTVEVRASQAKLQQSHHTLRRLAAHADQIKELERKRIAREIHDDLGQNLLALRIEAEMLASRTRHTHQLLHARAHATLHQIDTIIKSVRQIINDLRPNVLDLGLNAAVDWQVADFRRRTGIECELFENETELHLNDHCSTAFFRILQESLSNITRHAAATKVRIELHLFESRLSMSVSDNGVGLQPGGRSKHGSFGLVGIEERVSLLGGTFELNSEPGAGTTIVVSVPIDGQGVVPHPSPARTATVESGSLVA